MPMFLTCSSRNHQKPLIQQEGCPVNRCRRHQDLARRRVDGRRARRGPGPVAGGLPGGPSRAVRDRLGPHHRARGGRGAGGLPGLRARRQHRRRRPRHRRRDAQGQLTSRRARRRRVGREGRLTPAAFAQGPFRIAERTFSVRAEPASARGPATSWLVTLPAGVSRASRVNGSQVFGGITWSDTLPGRAAALLARPAQAA
jgi:hypothetical protein